MTVTIIDLETDGLNVQKNHLLEIGCAAVSDDLMKIYEIYYVIIKYPTNPKTALSPVASTLYHQADEFVQKMHTRNGLWEEIKHPDETARYSTVMQELGKFHKWLQDVQRTFSPDKQLILMGNTVGWDYAVLCRLWPGFLGFWDYHHVDLSVLLQELKMWDPLLYREIKGEEKNEEDEPHRVKDDIVESLELAYRHRQLLRGIAHPAHHYPGFQEWDTLDNLKTRFWPYGAHAK